MIRSEFGLGEGADVVIEATGAASCVQMGIFITKKGGTYVQAGMGQDHVDFPIATACLRDLTIRGSIRYTTGCYPTALDLVGSGKDRCQAVDHEPLLIRACEGSIRPGEEKGRRRSQGRDSGRQRLIVVTVT